jgi:hypothetical protein
MALVGYFFGAAARAVIIDARKYEHLLLLAHGDPYSNLHPEPNDSLLGYRRESAFCGKERGEEEPA